MRFTVPSILCESMVAQLCQSTENIKKNAYFNQTIRNRYNNNNNNDDDDDDEEEEEEEEEKEEDNQQKGELISARKTAQKYKKDPSRLR